MPDAIAQVNELKGLPDQALQSELVNPSGAVPAYLVLAEAQRRQLMRQSAVTSQNQAPVGSVYDDVIRDMMARQPPPGAAPAGATPPASAPPSAPQTPQNFRPPQGMAEGGEVDEVDDDEGNEGSGDGGDGGFDLNSAIDEVARRHGRDPNEMRAMVRAESDNNPNAVSPKGATGLLQLMPGTARQYGVKNSKDPIQNLEGGAKYLDYLYGLYPDNPSLVHAAWNAGPGAVQKYGGVPPYPETTKFIKRVNQFTAQNAASRAVESGMPDKASDVSAPTQPFISPEDWRSRQLAALQAPGAAPPGASDPETNPQLAAILASGSPSPAMPAAAPGAVSAPAAQAASANPFDPKALADSRDVYQGVYYGSQVPLTADQKALHDHIQKMWDEAEARKKPNFWQYLENFGLGMATTPSRNWAQSIAGGAAGMVKGIGAQQEEARKQELDLLGVSSKLDDQMRGEQGKIGDAVTAQARIQQQALNEAERAHAQAEAQAQRQLLQEQATAKRNAFNHALAFPLSVAGTHDAPPTPEYKEFVADPDDPTRGVWAPPSMMKVTPDAEPFAPKDPTTGMPVMMMPPAQLQALQTTARNVAQHKAEQTDKTVRPPELTDEVLNYWTKQSAADSSNFQLMPPAFKPFVAAELANSGVDIKHLDAAGRTLATPQDPSVVAYWVKQVAQDAKNWGLVQGNKPLAEAVRQGIAAAGGNVNQIDAMTRDAAIFSQKALTHVQDIRGQIDALAAKGKLGPIASRWNAFLGGTWGSGDPEYNALRSNIKLLQTAMGRVHGGARGGSSPAIMESMNSIMNAKTMDPAMLKSSLGVFENWLNTYATMAPGAGAAPGGIGGAAGGAPNDPLGLFKK